MFIKSLQLKNFKRFADLTIDFLDDITVIKGLNEQGKSTIVEGLIVALFYDPGKSNEPIKSGKSWGSEKLYSTNLKFESNGEIYNLTKDFETKSISLKNAESGDEIVEYKKVMPKLGKFGGYQTPELFLSTACVKQGELAILDRKQTITEALGDIVSSAGASVSLATILKRIEKARDEFKRGLERGVAKNPGRLLRLSNEKDDKERELLEKKKIFDEEDVYRQQLGQLSQDLEKNRSLLELKEGAYDEGNEYFKVKKGLDALNSEYDKTSKTVDGVDSISQEISSLRQSAGLLEKFKYADSKKFLDKQVHIKEQKTRIEFLNEQIKVMNEKGIKAENIFDKKYLAVVVAFAVLGVPGFFVHKAFFVSWGLLVAVLAGIFFFKLFTISVSVKKAEKELISLEEEAKEAEKKFTEELKELGVDSIEELEDKKNNWQETTNRIDILTGKLEGILAGDTPQELAQRKKEVEKKIAIEEQKLESLARSKPPTREEQIAMERDLKELREKVQDADRRIAGIEAVLAKSKASQEDIIQLEERMYSLGEEIKHASRKEKALAVLGESLLEAQQKTFSSTRKILEQYIGEFFSEITDGKYSAISIGQGMKIRVFSPEKDEEVDPQKSLSRGTIEQLYLVARFALVALLYRDGANSNNSSNIIPSRPLVILDDPFVNFDAVRRAKTRHIVRKLSQKFQVVLLTCSSEYDKWGKVIDLSSIK